MYQMLASSIWSSWRENLVFLYCRFSLFLKDPFFPDYLEVATAVVVPRGAGKTYVDIVLIFFHILVLQEYWVLAESRIPLKPVVGGVRVVALSISFHEKTQKNRVCGFLYCMLSLFLRDPCFPDYFVISGQKQHAQLLFAIWKV